MPSHTEMEYQELHAAAPDDSPRCSHSATGGPSRFASISD